MSNQEIRITLPDATTMMDRLQAVDDGPYIVEKFYPLLTKKAGIAMSPRQIILMLQLAISDSTEGMPNSTEAMLESNMEFYIHALVPDEQEASEVKSFWAELQ